MFLDFKDGFVLNVEIHLSVGKLVCLVRHVFKPTVFAVPNTNFVYFLTRVVAEVFGALRMYPSSVDTVVFASLTSYHEVRFNLPFTHAVERITHE